MVNLQFSFIKHLLMSLPISKFFVVEFSEWDGQSSEADVDNEQFPILRFE
jgi:hypothetical protein